MRPIYYKKLRWTVYLLGAIDEFMEHIQIREQFHCLYELFFENVQAVFNLKRINH